MNQPYEMDDERAAFITRNIGLAFEMLHELITRPDLIEGLPRAATVFVAPPDDPEYAQQQMERAQRFAEDGNCVIVWRLGADDGEARAIPVFQTTRGPEPAACTDAA